MSLVHFPYFSQAQLGFIHFSMLPDPEKALQTSKTFPAFRNLVQTLVFIWCIHMVLRLVGFAVAVLCDKEPVDHHRICCGGKVQSWQRVQHCGSSHRQPLPQGTTVCHRLACSHSHCRTQCMHAVCSLPLGLCNPSSWDCMAWMQSFPSSLSFFTALQKRFAMI